MTGSARTGERGGRRSRERLAVVASVLGVLTLAAGLTQAVADRRLAAEPQAVRTAAWFGGEQPAPPVEGEAAPTQTPASPPVPGPAPVPEVTSDRDQALTPPQPSPSQSPAAPAAAPAAAEAPSPPPGQPPTEQSTGRPAPPPPPKQRMQAASAESDSERIFRSQYPEHASARQVPGDRATRFWAVLVGVDDYQGRTTDTTTSVADATLLREQLLQRGWHDDHVLLLTNGTATRDNIIRGLEWLARKTDEHSVVVFSFSGHMRYQKGDPDGDGEYWDSGLWPVDNRFIWDADFARMFNAIRAARAWISFQGCHSGGMNDPGLEAPNRVITYSSLQSQKSYEDPYVGNSVQGWFLFKEGIADGQGDPDGDGRVTIQDAYAWAAPRAEMRTSGKQSPQFYDGLGRPFWLEAV